MKIISEKTALQVLRRLIHEDRISEDEIYSKIVVDPPDDVKIAVDLFHSYFCYNNHSSGECTYYQEEPLEDCWQRDAHIDWTSSALSTMRFYEVDAECLINGIRTVTNIIVNITSRKDERLLMYLLRSYMHNEDIGKERPQLPPNAGGNETLV